MSKKITVVLSSVVCLLALGLATAGSASATQRIDMKVLLLGSSTTEADYTAWKAALEREGVPFESIITSKGHTPITAATLSDTLPSGTQEAKYQAVIMPVPGLIECTEAGCAETISSTEKTALEEYEQTFNVRQITGEVFPNATYGLNAPTVSGPLGPEPATKTPAVEGTLTAEGKKAFPYLNGPVSMDVGTFGYEATPLTTQATGTTFTPLLEGPSKSALVGVFKRANGTEELIETFNGNPFQLQSELLRHGALNWVTRGIYFGDQRNYYEADIDDNFLFDDSWNTTTHETNFVPSEAIREVPADVVNAAKWSAENKFRMDMLFNGGGSVQYAKEKANAVGGIGGILEKIVNGGNGTDPLLAEFAKDKNDFGWISHTWDHPNIDIGCASQSYIEAELNQNNKWAGEAPGAGANAGTGGLGLTESTSPTAALGNDNPTVIITGEHSGLANLRPGNPGVVDPPSFDSAEENVTEVAEEKLAAANYTYAITDDFVPGGGETSASTTAITVKANASVTLQWNAVCHAAEYKIYREVTGSNKWSLIKIIPAPTAEPPNSSFGNPPNNKEVGEVTKAEEEKGEKLVPGGSLVQTFTDEGAAGTASAAPPTTNNAVESPYPQNPQLSSAFMGVGIKYFGSDASKAYPNPAIPGSTAEAFPAGATFTDSGAEAIPRYPTNIYYNVSTEAQEVDEFNSLYTPVEKGGKCVASETTTCETAPVTFKGVVQDVDTNMFQHLMGNDPRPHYFHQPNIMGTPPPGEATEGTPPNTSPAKGDGLFYSVLNPLLTEYKKYFSTPIEQPTMAQIGEILMRQKEWAAASASQVSGYIEGNKVTINNSGATAANVPLTGVSTVGAVYGGIRSGWESAPAAASTVTSEATWPVAAEPVQKEPQGTWFGKYGSSGYLLPGWDGAQDVSDMPGVTVNLLQGSRFRWASATSDIRALQGPEGSNRNAATYFDSSEIKLQLTFAKAESTNLHLYAVDWDSTARNETITVNDGSGPREVVLSSFHEGDWVSVPITVAEKGTVSITVHCNSGANAVLSGVFLGEGAAPAITPQELSKGGWVGSFGQEGYDLAGWDGPTGDVSYMPHATIALVEGSRYQWAARTEDARALQEPGQPFPLTRNASAYYDPNQIEVTLGFNAEYTGNIHLYAIDWDSTTRRETISVNGQTAVLSSSFHEGAWVTFPIHVASGEKVTITVDRTAGANAVLSGILLGDAGAPAALGVASPPQGEWIGAVGSAGYDLAGWDGVTGDVSYLPHEAVTLLQGARFRWAQNAADTRALSDPAGLTRNASAYYDPNEIQIKLTFSEAYVGNLHLYAVDWDHGTRREIISVRGRSAVLSKDFSEGAWTTFPINVSAGGSVMITVDRTFGPNAVLSGIFLGDNGAPAALPVSSTPQGNWVGVYGSKGYDLAAWGPGSTDVTSLANASMNLTQGSRYQWVPTTSDERALESADTSSRVAATYFDNNQLQLQMTFSAAYSGNLELYAVDWDSTNRREIVTVNGMSGLLSGEFGQGAWLSFPISVQAGETVTITVDRLAGANAVLSGVFLE